MKMSNAKKGILLINLGTPDSPSVKDVRKYLREFLMDGRVIDIPYLARCFFVYGIIVPFRGPKSAKVYQRLWQPAGSPLKIYGEQVRDLLQTSLGYDYIVELGMRYQNPSIPFALNRLKDKGLEEIAVIPLYPQYAESSTGSSIEKVLGEMRKWRLLPNLKIISQFHDHPLFLESFCNIGRAYMEKNSYDHYVFTYHGLPERQILKASIDSYCRLNQKCCLSYHRKNRYCYRAQCFETTRNLAQLLGLKEGEYTICFQSRLGRTPWMKPYTDEVIPQLIQRGIKRVLVFSPSFIADCLETTVEIGVEYKKMFLGQGGEQWDLVDSLNTNPEWIECLSQLVTEQNQESGTFARSIDN